MLRLVSRILGSLENQVKSAEEISLKEWEKERDFLNDFLDGNKAAIDKGTIESLLCEFRTGKGALGRGIYIGNRIYLTASHVADHDESGISHPLTTEEKLHLKSFSVLEQGYDHENDSALVKSQFPQCPDYKKPPIRLSSKKPNVGDKISIFLKYDGPGLYGQRELKLDGALPGFKYDGHVNFIFDPDSGFIEIQGVIIHNAENPPPKKRITGFHRIGFEANLPIYPGLSGSPVFLRASDNIYELLGVVCRISGIARHPPPGSPFYRKEGYLSGMLATDNANIKKLILPLAKGPL